MELVSVVIPMYNAERTILRAIESVRAQTYTAWELILIDDGSTDGTLPLVEDYVARYGLPAVVVSRENRGVSHTRNEGIRLAQGGYVAFLDADDVWMPRKLERQMACLKDTGGRFVSGLKTEPAANQPPVSVVTLRQMLFRNAVFTSGVLAEKALLEEVGGFDETMGYAEDYNLWLRIACTEPLRVIGEKLLIYEGDTAAAGRQSLSSNLREMERGELQNYRMLRREGRIGVPLYLAASNLSVLFILWFGAKNVLGTGWRAWDIAAFTTFLSCFMKTAVKSSKAAKLFNAVQRAEVSWKRIKPMMKTLRALEPLAIPAAQRVEVSGLSFCYDGGAPIFEGVSFSAQPGDIIGVTGPVACGKSTLGRVFLGERPYGGSVRIGGRELSELSPREAASTVGYLGHDPELWNDTVEENVLCGEAGDAMRFLALTALDGEVRAMEQGLQTVVGSGGVRLSGGQAQRLALARTLAHPRPVLVLDDPFSALDRRTEDEVFARLKACAQDRVVILISHRLYHFPELRQIVFMQDGKADVGTHEALCASVPAYRALYESQTGGAAHEA